MRFVGGKGMVVSEAEDCKVREGKSKDGSADNERTNTRKVAGSR